MRTKELIAQAFVRLIDKNPFDKITTQMILDECGVSRSTFYRHFKDKYEVMSWHYQSRIEQMRSRYPFSDYRLFLIDFADFIQKNQPYFLRIIRTTGTNSFFSFLSGYSMDYYEPIYKTELGIPELSPRDHCQILLIVEGSNAVLKQYILSGCHEPPEEMADCIIESLPACLKSLLK